MANSLGLASRPLLSSSSRDSFDDYGSPRPSPLSGLKRRRPLVTTTIFVSAGLFSTLLLGFFAGYNIQRTSAHPEAHMHSYHKNNNYGPANDAVSVLFQEMPVYSGPPSNESDAAWIALIPAGRGFVELGMADQEGEEQGRYCVSVFHQLHCLNMIRQGFYGSMGNSDLKATPVAPDGGPESPVPSDFHHQATKQGHATAAHASSHMQHCFDYLRQALMCGADAALEERSDDISGVRGWGTRHQCRNFEALKAWTEEHRYSDEKGIDN